MFAELVTPLMGGMLIGAAASLLLLASGRIAGVSGIFGGLLDARPGDVSWRTAFVAGLVIAGIVGVQVYPEAFVVELERSPLALAVGGLLVGFGARLGNGCTSGHGVCGLSRFSPRSLASVATFMVTGGIMAFVVNHLLGGA